MRDYGRVSCKFWSSPKIRQLSPDAERLAIYLLTCEHCTIAGVFRLPDGYAGDDLQWPTEMVSQGFAELFRNGFATRCERTKWVWIYDFLQHNPLANPNQRKAAAKVAEAIPVSCAWRVDFYGVFPDFLAGGTPAIRNRCGTVSEPFRNQDQEQEQKQDQKRVRGAGQNENENHEDPPPLTGELIQAVEPLPRPKAATKGKRPTLPELAAYMRDYCAAKNINADPALQAERFIDHFESNGWRVGGKAPMASWQAAARNWLTRAEGKNHGNSSAGSSKSFYDPIIEANRRLREQLGDVQPLGDLDEW